MMDNMEMWAEHMGIDLDQYDREMMKDPSDPYHKGRAFYAPPEALEKWEKAKQGELDIDKQDKPVDTSPAFTH